MLIGTTYSHLYAKQLGLDVDETFQELLQFKFDVVRLCCYWKEVQPAKEKFDYTALKNLLDHCEAHKLDVVMTVGMKAPRWPEFYIPRWLKPDDPDFNTYLLQFIKKTVTELQSYSCIKSWQVENEPLDPSGPEQKTIPLSLLKEEINLVKELDPQRKIILTAWGNELIERNCVPDLHPQADIVGLDIYYKVPRHQILNKTIYQGPRDPISKIIDHLTCTTKPVWIMELQAEPWEKGFVIPRMKNPKSMNATILENNYHQALKLNPQAILFWGFEYWIWRKKVLNDPSLWQTVQQYTQP